MSDHIPESLLLASILAEQCVYHQEGHWSQNDWPSPENPRIRAMRQSSSGFPYPPALCPGALSQ